MINAVALLVLALGALLFFFLASRAWRSRRGVIRYPGVILSSLLGLALLAVTVVALIGLYRLNTPPHTYASTNIPVTGSADAIARGERLAHICADCHSSTGDLPLDGSAESLLADPAAPPVGVLWAPDLTPSGSIKDWTDAEVARAIREGVDNKGRPLIIMPSLAFQHLSDEDVMALVAYLRSQQPSGRSLPPRDLNLLAALFIGGGIFPTSAQDPITQPITAPQPGTAEYGNYLVSIAGCRDCHGETLSGEPAYFGTTAPNLRVQIKNHTSDQFLNFFSTGILPEGRPVSPEVMPWANYRKTFTDQELTDIYNYLDNLSPAQTSQ